MSRSFKHSPVSTDGKRRTTKQSKKFANKTIRHYKKGLPNGKAYKKLFCSYNIHDWISYWSWSQAQKDWNRLFFLQKEYPTLKQFYIFWYKCQKRK